MVFGVDFITEFGNHIRCILNQVGILFDTGFHQSHQNMEAAREIAGINEHALDSFVETAKFLVMRSHQDIVLHNEVNRFDLKIRVQEVTVGHNRVIRLDITAGHLDFLHFLIFLDIDFEESFQRILCLITNVEQVDPDNIFLIQLLEGVDGLCNFYFLVVFIEYSQFCHGCKRLVRLINSSTLNCSGRLLNISANSSLQQGLSKNSCKELRSCFRR